MSGGVRGISERLSSSITESLGPFRWILGRSQGIRRLAEHATRAAQLECPVLIWGETGTGKELWANLIHQSGPRCSKPFIPVNCAALSPTLAESQLFGHEKGAFTGALGAALGAFRAADGGILFLDEVGEMPLELQPKLLRVLEQSEVTPVGSSHPQQVSVQLIAATNRDLREEVAAGRFRRDLYYRLNMLELRLPALRERVEDVPDLVTFFSETYARQYSRPVWRADRATLEAFCAFEWPGNIRQLAHVIEQSYVLDCAPSLPTPSDQARDSGPLPFLNLAKLREEAVRQALTATLGHKGRAAQLLGVHANTLTRMLANLEPDPNRPSPSTCDHQGAPKLPR